MELPIRDRALAGRELALELAGYRGRGDVVVLGLPRGGVVVAEEIARALEAPLDVMLVRKLGVPEHRELAMGAIASGGVRILNPEVVRQVDEEDVEAVAREEEEELERRQRAYRGNRPWPRLEGRTVLLVDDGLATGATMKAAIQAVRRLGASRVVAVAPVGPWDTIQEIEELADEVVCPAVPEPFYSISQWYERFDQTTDEEVMEILARTREEAP